MLRCSLKLTSEILPSVNLHTSRVRDYQMRLTVTLKPEGLLCILHDSCDAHVVARSSQNQSHVEVVQDMISANTLLEFNVGTSSHVV